MKPFKSKRGVAISSVLVVSCVCFLVGYHSGTRGTHSGSQAHLSSILDNMKGSSAWLMHSSGVCLNTCSKAHNGVCDDGRFGQATDSGKSREVTCDLGTDCADCGPWTPSGPAPWVTDGVPGPVARLAAEGAKVRAITARFSPSFQFAYADPEADMDVSRHVEATGNLEYLISHVFKTILKDGCMSPSGQAALVVDVGANFGWFSVLSAVMGCRVIAYEPVPLFAAYLEYNLHLNGLAHRVTVHHNLVSHMAGGTLKMTVPSRGTWGTAGIGGLNIDHAIEGSLNREIEVESKRLDDMIDEDVLLLKVDVEGWEWSVMQGASKLASKHVIQNVVMEYSPGVPERHALSEAMKASAQMLVNLADQGFRIAHLAYTLAHDGHADLNTFPEITRQNMYYDLVDSEMFSRRQLGCPKPHALVRKWPYLSGCNTVPESSSPRSLRGNIGHNTNIWASKNRRIQRLGRNTAAVPLDAPYETYFVEPGWDFGMGGRKCSTTPPDRQVFNRCPCTDKYVCGEEEMVTAKVAADEPGFPSSYLLSPEGNLVAGTGFVEEVFRSIRSARELGAPYLPGAVTGPLDVKTSNTAAS